MKRIALLLITFCSSTLSLADGEALNPRWNVELGVAFFSFGKTHASAQELGVVRPVFDAATWIGLFTQRVSYQGTTDFNQWTFGVSGYRFFEGTAGKGWFAHFAPGYSTLEEKPTGGTRSSKNGFTGQFGIGRGFPLGDSSFVVEYQVGLTAPMASDNRTYFTLLVAKYFF